MITTEHVKTRDLTLEKVHTRLGAHFVEQEGWRLPASYGDQNSEYSVIREGGAGLIDLSSRGRIRVGGSEAIMFLNGLISNDMKTLEKNRWMPAVFPNVQGRLIASVRVARLGDEDLGKGLVPTFIIDTEAATSDRVLKTIERFTKAGDFRVTDITNDTTMLTVQGPGAMNVTSTVLGGSVTSIPKDGALDIDWQGQQVTTIRATHTAEDGFDLIVPNSLGEQLWSELMSAGAQPVGHNTLEVLGIEAGIPRYGRDMDESNVVTETSLDDAVSFTKGCYIGQEIIARIKYRGHVAKKLSGLVLENDVAVETGAMIKSTEGKDIGRVTSLAYSPKLKCIVALGYVRYEFLATGTSLKIFGQQGQLDAKVHELPFIRGSWNES